MIGIWMADYEVITSISQAPPSPTISRQPRRRHRHAGRRHHRQLGEFRESQLGRRLQRVRVNLNRSVPISAYVHDGNRVNTNLTVSTTATAPDNFDLFSLGFVPKMQTTPVEVSALVAGTPAETAGLKPGDQIVTIDRVPVHSVNSLLAYLQDQKGKPAILDVLRSGQHVAIPITCSAPADASATAPRLTASASSSFPCP